MFIVGQIQEKSTPGSGKLVHQVRNHDTSEEARRHAVRDAGSRTLSEGQKEPPFWAVGQNESSCQFFKTLDHKSRTN